MRISSIDVGSNAIRQVIVDVLPSGQWVTLKKFRAPLRLGADVFSTGFIQPSTEAELIQVFKKMAKLNKRYKAQKIITLATSAMRDAKNSRQVISHLKQKTHIDVKVITGANEAQLIQNAIFQSRIVNFESSLLMDIGGGSTEFTIFRNSKIMTAHSFPLGVVRLLHLSQRSKKSISEMCRPFLKRVRQNAHTTKIDIVIGTGGNFDALSKLKLQLLKKTPHTNVTLSELKAIYQRWNKMTLAQKEKLNIRKDRIDVLPLALELILATMLEFNISKIKIPLTGLKEGAILSC